MTLASPWGLLALGLAIPIVVLHILRPRRQAVTVSSIFLWEGIERPVSSAVPWQRLRRSWLLALQLLAVLLGALVLAHPVRLTPARLAEHTVFIVDTSSSMGALDGTPDRLASAKADAEEVRDELPAGGRASIVVAGLRPRVVLTSSDDRQAFTDALGLVQLSEGAADFAGAFALAESLQTTDAAIGYVLLSDGGLTEEEQRQQPPGTQYHRVGSRDLDRAISALTVEQRGSELHVRATLKNTGGPTATQQLRFDVDGVTAVTKSVELKPGVAVDVEADVPAGDRVEAFLEGGDLLPADDHAVAVAGRRPDLDVLLVGDPLFLGDLFRSIPGVTVTESDDPAATGDGFDVVVYDEVTVPSDVAAPYLAVAPPGGAPGVSVTGVLDRPAVTLLRTDDPLVNGLDLTTVAIAAAQRVDAPLADQLAAAEGGPLLLTGSTPAGGGGALRYVYLAFALQDSNLPVQVVFPLLGDRVLTELAGTSVPSTALTVGDELPVGAGTDVTLIAPDGATRSVDATHGSVRVDRAGFWAIRRGDTERLVAVNPPRSESLLAPADELIKPATATAGDRSASRGERSLEGWVIGALLIVLLLEFLLARRSVGVSRRQWRLAIAARMAVAALLVAAFLAPVIRRSADRVATVFVLDVSDSLGSSGQSEAARWVAQALDARRDGDLAAVVAFGGEARLDRLLEASSSFGVPRVVVDRSSTNLEAALRLADAVLPDDARRRVVLVSDGRATIGDTTAQAEELAQRGTPIDVHLIEPTTGTDAAMAQIDGPSLARVGESVTIDASVSATSAGEADVVLKRDGAEVARQRVTLVPGDNPVRFTDTPPASAGSVLRYQVTVDQGGDVQVANDSGFVAVPVDGPARVLLVEGREGGADTLGRALQAGGLTAETIGVDALPDTQTLATYSSVVLVDVDARELSTDQSAALTAAVRDLGRGLVTIGGERSYGVGGYRGSPLENLLPVISEVLDPKRRKTVAEVLSIDVSGSMANCHCDDGENPATRIGGGVNKTDISRAAAARTIEALSESDQIGILAWNASSKWIVDLQQLPADDVVEDGLRKLKPAGGTNLGDSLEAAAEALRDSRAGLKHIILFSDGFTSVDIIEDVADQAGELYESDGITVSVVATGEGAAPSLEAIADAGHGRYYPGRDLQQVPQIIAEEAVTASRDFITEGSFLPEVTAATAVTDDLTTAPPLLGYVATTAKGTATTSLRIGPDRDPLLATWQAGLGTVTSWTSDAATAWSRPWVGWDGFVGFWSSVVKDSFPAGDTAGAATAALVDGRLSIELDAAAGVPDGATALAVVAGPDGQRTEVALERTSQGVLSADVPAPRDGSYAVGVTVTAGGQTVLSSTALASESYPREYRPGPADRTTMDRLSAVTGGRGEIAADAAFDVSNLRAGTTAIALRRLLLVLAVLLWPLAVLLSRWSLRGATVSGAVAGARRGGRRLKAALPSVLPMDPVAGGTRSSSPPEPVTPQREPTPPSPRPAAQPTSAPTSSVEALLERKRSRDRPASS